MKKNYSLPFAILVGFVLIISSIACHRRSAADDETPDTSGYRPEATPATPYERDVKYVRDGHFVNIWVFRRKDDKPLTPEDSQVLRTNASRVVDWATTDPNKKYVIAGSNFAIEPENMAVLQKRFNVELLPSQP